MPGVWGVGFWVGVVGVLDYGLCVGLCVVLIGVPGFWVGVVGALDKGVYLSTYVRAYNKKPPSHHTQTPPHTHLEVRAPAFLGQPFAELRQGEVGEVKREALQR